MGTLLLHEFHNALNARFTSVNGQEAPAHYGDVQTEWRALKTNAGLIDLTFRSRLCLLGEDRRKFLNGQVTNNVNDLSPGEGCYAALVSARGKMQSDLNIYRLENEMLLDFEPGLAEPVTRRLEKYIIADDVQVIDASPAYGLLSVQGPRAPAALARLHLAPGLPGKPFQIIAINDPNLGELYLANNARLDTAGFDLFAPVQSLDAIADKLVAACREAGGGLCGWEALELARIEAGIPRYGIDMDETNLPPEAGIESRAISYSKGCYIGQEVIARIRTYGQVAKALCKLRLTNDLPAPPARGDKLFHDGRESGYITSAAKSPALNAHIALGYIRREANQTGTTLTLRTAHGDHPATVEGKIGTKG